MNWEVLESMIWALALLVQGLFQKLKAASGKDIKGHFFPLKPTKKAPVIWATPMHIAYLHCFW